MFPKMRPKDQMICATFFCELDGVEDFAPAMMRRLALRGCGVGNPFLTLCSQELLLELLQKSAMPPDLTPSGENIDIPANIYFSCDADATFR